MKKNIEILKAGKVLEKKFSENCRQCLQNILWWKIRFLCEKLGFLKFRYFAKKIFDFDKIPIITKI